MSNLIGQNHHLEHFQSQTWLARITILNICKVKPDWPESPFGTFVKSNLISQNHLVNKANFVYNLVAGMSRNTPNRIRTEHLTFFLLKPFNEGQSPVINYLPWQTNSWLFKLLTLSYQFVYFVFIVEF